MAHTNYHVRCIDDCTRFNLNEVLEVTSISADAKGNVLIGIDGNLPIWDVSHFETVEHFEPYIEGVTRYEPPDSTVCISAREMDKLVDAQMWWEACLLGKVIEYCNWPDIMEHYKQLKKESLE